MDNLGRSHYNPFWNKKNGRISEAFAEFSAKNPSEEESGRNRVKAPHESTLSKLLKTSNSTKWQGGALQRVQAAGGAAAAAPNAKLAPRPPAPTAGGLPPRAPSAVVVPAPTAGSAAAAALHVSAEASRSLPTASTLDPGDTARKIQSKIQALVAQVGKMRDDDPEMDVAVRKMKALEKLRDKDQQTGQGAPSHPLHHHQQQQQPQPQPQRHQPPAAAAAAAAAMKKRPAAAQMHSFAAGSNKNTISMTRGASFGSAKPSDAKNKNQPFLLDIELAEDGCDTVSTSDRLLVRAKSFPEYPAHTVLMGLGHSVYKRMVEKGTEALWEVKPTSAYKTLLELATEERLLAVEDGVMKRLKDLRDDVSMWEKSLSLAEDDAREAGVALTPAVAAAAEAAAAREGGGGRGDRGGGGMGGRGGLGGRGRGRGRGRGGGKGSAANAADVSAAADAAASPPMRWNPEPWSASVDEERIGGMNEKELAAAITITLKKMSTKVSPATASGTVVVRVLKAVEAEHFINLGVKINVNSNLGHDPQLPPMVARAVQRCGFPADFQARGAALATAAKGDGRYAPPQAPAPGPGLSLGPALAPGWFSGGNKSSDDVEVIDVDDDGDGIECIDLISDDEEEEETPQPPLAAASASGVIPNGRAAAAAAAACVQLTQELPPAAAPSTQSPSVADMFGRREAGPGGSGGCGGSSVERSQGSQGSQAPRRVDAGIPSGRAAGTRTSADDEGEGEGEGEGVCLGVSAEERRKKLAAINAAALELSRLRKKLRRLEVAIRPNFKRKRGRAPSEATYAFDGGGVGFDFGTGAGLAWEGQGSGSMGMNVDFF